MRTNSALKATALAFTFCAVAACGLVFARASDSGSNAAFSKKDAHGQLFSRIYGCEAAGTIGNSMGDVTEGLSWRKIEDRYGLVDRLLPQDKKASRRPQPFGPDWVRHAHHRPPGMTEDGFERHRLCTSAILKRGGRITIEDLARTWIE
ncbi:MAG: hypothetical protein JSW47_15395, partial [Phycisphaerales bacterium]